MNRQRKDLQFLVKISELDISIDSILKPIKIFFLGLFSLSDKLEFQR